MIKGVRGATTIFNNCEEEIMNNTKVLLNTILDKNNICLDDIVSVFFSITKDITVAYPAKAARELGWTDIPLMNFTEPDVENSLKKCIRVLIHFNTSKTHNEIKHVYLNDAKVLRPDLLDN